MKCFTFLQASFVSGSIENSWILISADSIYCNMLFWLRSVKENLTSHRCIIGKRRSILKAFWDVDILLWHDTNNQHTQSNL